MKVNEKLAQAGINPETVDFSDVLKLLGETDSLTLKKDDVATDLISLLAYEGTNRSSLAEKIGYKKSRITRILSGLENLTIKTIHDVSKSIGYEFDVIFRKATDSRALQPWQTNKSAFSNLEKGRLILVPSVLSSSTQPSTLHAANDNKWHFAGTLERVRA
jgi:antitoxin component HigA of HigAB toxin-antitoxin module